MREWISNNKTQLGIPAILLLYYFQNISNEKGECWPKWKTIQNQTGLSRSSIARAIRTLQSIGVISISGKVKGASKYALNLDGMVTPRCHIDTPGVSHRHPEVPKEDPILITKMITNRSTEMPTKSQRNPRNGTFQELHAQRLKGSITVTNKHSLIRWWEKQISEREGFPVGLSVKEQKMLTSIIPKFDYDWEKIKDVCDCCLENWEGFRDTINLDYGAKIGSKPNPGALAAYPHNALAFWQSIAKISRPTKKVLQMPERESIVPRIRNSRLTAEQREEVARLLNQ